MERIELDPNLELIGRNIEEVVRRFSPYSRSYRMDRKASHIYRLELKVMQSGAWARMKRKVDLGTATRDDPAPRVVKIRRLANAGATAGDYLEIDLSTAKLPDKLLKKTIAHELIHYWLHDTGAYRGARAQDLRKGRNDGTDAHGRLFRECCAAYGIQDGWAHEVLHKWQYKCPCGWWLKTADKRQYQIRCQNCRKLMVTPTEYARLKKVAAIGSRTAPIKIEDYVIMKVKRLA